MEGNQFRLRLLPNYYKRIGYVILVLSVLFISLFKLKILIIDQEIVWVISNIGVLISLLILAITRNKIEDELTYRIRVQAIGRSFVFGVLYVIFNLFLKLQFPDHSVLDDGAVGILLLMFIFYFITFHSMLYNR